MHRARTLLRYIPSLGLALMLVAAPGAANASDHCAISVEPDTVTVGETFVVTATGFEPNENAQGLAALDPGVSFEISIAIDADGAFTRTVVAQDFMIGTSSVSMTGDSSLCGASAELTVLAAIRPPNTDALVAGSVHGRSPDAGLLAAGFVVAAAASWWLVRRRLSARSDPRAEPGRSG